ncbi:DinB family protein [Chryseobacterium sp. CT-SW4]|uniref:DinB family protein n=1 Tax=Chryseobacterium sp. SW-1 TaxID=3157343 RepID=UPI003B01CA21
MTPFEQYIKGYSDLIPSGNWLEEMKTSGQKTLKIYKELTEDQSHFAYAEGKWTLKELLLHLSDTERVFQYRALAFARGEKAQLPGFDENIYAGNSHANERSLKSLIEEYELIRRLSQLTFETFNHNVLENKGNANGNEISVETLGKLIVGHNYHHLHIIEERYLPNL